MTLAQNAYTTSVRSLTRRQMIAEIRPLAEARGAYWVRVNGSLKYGKHHLAELTDLQITMVHGAAVGREFT